MLDTQTIVYIAVFIGVLTRTLIPYLRKLKEAQEEGKTISFDVKYIYTAIVAVVTSVITANVLIMVIPPELLANNGVKLFMFIFGWSFQHSSNDVFNEMIAT